MFPNVIYNTVNQIHDARAKYDVYLISMPAAEGNLKIQKQWTWLYNDVHCMFFHDLQWRHSVISWARGYKTFFMLNSTEHEILNAHKYENMKKSSFFQSQISRE